MPIRSSHVECKSSFIQKNTLCLLSRSDIVGLHNNWFYRWSDNIVFRMTYFLNCIAFSERRDDRKPFESPKRVLFVLHIK